MEGRKELGTLEFLTFAVVAHLTMSMSQSRTAISCLSACVDPEVGILLSTELRSAVLLFLFLTPGTLVTESRNVLVDWNQGTGGTMEGTIKTVGFLKA